MIKKTKQSIHIIKKMSRHIAHNEKITGVTKQPHGEVALQTETTEVTHEPTLFAEPIVAVGGFTITNSLVMTWAVVLIVVAISIAIKFSLKMIPKGIQNIFEMVIEGAMSISDSVTGSRKKTLLFFPVVFALFIFILLNNWLGLIPGIGIIGYTELQDGHTAFIPFLRGGTADLNTTLALALFAVVASHVIGIVMIGAWNHLNKFINIKALLEIPKKMKEDPTVIVVNPIKVFVGFIEIIGEVAKVASLSFRLYGNIFAGEVLLAAMAAIFAFLLPLPFMFLEVLVGIIQALVFAMLTLVYFSMASTAEEH